MKFRSRKTFISNGDLIREYIYTVIFEPQQAGGYNVAVPAIPEICTFGQNLKEARIMAEDAIRCYLESASNLGVDIPVDISVDQSILREQMAVSL